MDKIGGLLHLKKVWCLKAPLQNSNSTELSCCVKSRILTEESHVFCREDADGLCTQLTEAVPKEDKAVLEKEKRALRDKGWVLDDASLAFCTEKIGKGEFGNVLLGTLTAGRYAGQKVAVKVLKDISQRKMQFLAEASVMT